MKEPGRVKLVHGGGGEAIHQPSERCPKGMHHRVQIITMGFEGFSTPQYTS
jgi:hypothetical protein